MARKIDVIDVDKRPICREYQKTDELYGATAGCEGRIYSDFYGGGGVKCTRCRGWFCY